MKFTLKSILSISIPTLIGFYIIKFIMGLEFMQSSRKYIFPFLIISIIILLIYILKKFLFFMNLNKINEEFISKKSSFEQYEDKILLKVKNTKDRYDRATLYVSYANNAVKEKKYEKAITILNEINLKYINSGRKLIYYVALITCDFHLNEYDMVVKLVDHVRKDMDKYKESRFVGENIATIDMYYEISKNNKIGAKKLILEARNKWKNSEMKNEWEYLEKKFLL